MKESNRPASKISDEQCIKLELLHSVLDDGEVYPWNAYDPTTAAYVDDLENTFASEDSFDDGFDSQWQQVSQIAGQIWAESSESLVAVLAQKFGSRVSLNQLGQIAKAAEAVSRSSLALVDQLVESVQSVLDSWEVEDLQVMARPLAMAMRGGQEEILDVTLRSVRQVEWGELSELEKARLSLAIARYALDELSENA
ncbi:hypothetical protein PN498_05785 [Oscillatoria sp. CS-180]|uniref:hypothetical protein n=1 Tax=Oscillatoria sp. CS-180 TaxID=3021720 RepID=UPI00233003C6|nr:hypothetical protein [Oscillatoria sp. CS-180]MDB9525490.1 hypothetical protein [Oscillatoria sp. CS-180]